MAADSTAATFDGKSFVKSLTEAPGVYRMLDASGQVLYVGKARNLKKRVASYFCVSNLAPKTRAMLRHVSAVEVIVTRTENEALILENNLIKRFKPRYNILLRDDKSYPYIYLSSEQRYPRLAFHRGAKRAPGRYFGPYPNASAVRGSLKLLQKLFPIRQCEDSVFSNRSRPCLQHQIGRCSAPCVGLINKQDYHQDVLHTILFLEGKSDAVAHALSQEMEQAAATLAFEKAAQRRDQLTQLRQLQEKQFVSADKGDIDIVVAVCAAGAACVQVFFIREGHNLGNRCFFPRHAEDSQAADIIAAFLPQYYLGKSVPKEILLNHEINDSEVLAAVLSEQAQHKVALRSQIRGDRARWVMMAEDNATKALNSHLTSKAGNRQRLEALQAALGLATLPMRMECFDISHTQGEETVAACVVFEQGAPMKSDYRRFNIKGVSAGDDYEAMRQAIRRRYRRLQDGEGKGADLLLIDGGKGQVGAAQAVLEALHVTDLVLIGVAKGAGRKPGLETLHIAASGATLALAADSPALHLIQQIRDEAHRFAITGHRQRRAKAQTRSRLEEIPGLGPVRRRRLLSHFGGWREVCNAAVEELQRVPGISHQLAQRIHDAFHLEEDGAQYV